MRICDEVTRGGRRYFFGGGFFFGEEQLSETTRARLALARGAATGGQASTVGNWDRVGKPRVLHGLVGFFTFGLGIFHPWVNGYGYCWNIPIPAYPMGEGFGPFTYPWVMCLVHI